MILSFQVMVPRRIPRYDVTAVYNTEVIAMGYSNVVKALILNLTAAAAQEIKIAMTQKLASCSLICRNSNQLQRFQYQQYHRGPGHVGKKQPSQQQRQSIATQCRENTFSVPFNCIFGRSVTRGGQSSATAIDPPIDAGCLYPSGDLKIIQAVAA